jgi:hypothetical protein
VKNEILHRVKEEKKILHTIKWRKTNWIGHVLSRNCLLKHVIEGRIKGRRDEEDDVTSYLKETREH